MRAFLLYLTACAVAALLPVLPMKTDSAVAREGGLLFAGWPTHIAERSLQELPLTKLEQRFMAGFPGRLARFSDGKREIVIRWVTHETRKLHPAADCFKGVGYTVTPLPLWTDSENARWGSFAATRKGETLRVYERIYDEAGNSWTDVSSWYWAAFFGETSGPWWAITIAEKSSY